MRFPANHTWCNRQNPNFIYSAFSAIIVLFVLNKRVIVQFYKHTAQLHFLFRDLNNNYYVLYFMIIRINVLLFII